MHPPTFPLYKTTGSPTDKRSHCTVTTKIGTVGCGVGTIDGRHGMEIQRNDTKRPVHEAKFGNTIQVSATLVQPCVIVVRERRISVRRYGVLVQMDAVPTGGADDWYKDGVRLNTIRPSLYNDAVNPYKSITNPCDDRSNLYRTRPVCCREKTRTGRHPGKCVGSVLTNHAISTLGNGLVGYGSNRQK